MDSITYWKGMVGDQYDKIKKFTRTNDLLEYAYKTFKNKHAVEWLNNFRTYDNLHSDVAMLRKIFIDKGIKKGDNVAMIFKNDYNYIRTFFALTGIGATAVIVPPMLPSQALFGSIKKFDCVAVIYGEEAENTMIEVKDMIASIPFISYKELDEKNEGAPADESVKPEDAAVIIFTGGTTGTPKGAVLSHRAILRGSYNGVFNEGKIFELKYMVLIPFFHIFGLVRNLLTSVNSGSCVYLVKEMMHFIKEIQVAKPEIMVMVPALANLIYSMILQHGKESVGGRLKCIICGGAHVNAETIKAFLNLGIKLCPGYGMTETANLTTGNINCADKYDSVGVVYPDQEVKIVNGEIWIKGDNLFTGYYKDPIETNHAMSEDGFIKSGDLGRFDKDGFLYIVGRSKNIIVLDNGENVSPEVIEEALDNIPLVNSSLIYEDKNEKGRGIIAAKIFPNYNVLKKMGYEDAEMAIRGVVTQVNEKMPDYMRITKVTVLKEDFKRSGAMKIIRKANI